ncbi:FAD binding domain-containing protein [Rhodococcus koreensis]
MPQPNTFKVLVAGGSVGGLAAAHELRAVGADAVVYERSAGRMQARGAGIVMQPEVESLLVRLGASARSVSVELFERQQLHIHGRPIRYAAPQLMTAWDTLYRILKEALPEGSYHLDSELRAVTVDGNRVNTEFADGTTAQSNFYVGADGIGSTTRQLIDPTSYSSYSGYVAWRGLEPESALSNELLDLLNGRFTFFGSAGLQMLCYLVPGPNGELDEGNRRVNWVWYMNVPERVLPTLLAGRSGRTYTNFLPPGELSKEVTAKLMSTANDSLPAEFAELVRSSHVFMQPVYDLRPRRMLADHGVLIGDAAGTVRPHTASGTSKAFGDAAGLAAAIRGWTPVQAPPPAARLAHWERQRLSHLHRLAQSGVELADRSGLGTTAGRQFMTSL